MDGVLSAQMSNSINQLSALPRAQHWDFSGLAYLSQKAKVLQPEEHSQSSELPVTGTR